jgi:proline racemase
MRLKNMITAVDVHACGEPGRVITGGILDVPGESMFEKRVYFERHLDHVRKRMLREPRGYPGLCCNVIMPPTHPDADAGFIIMEQAEYPAMSGSNAICVTTALIETGMVPVEEPITRLKLEAPAGLIEVEARVSNGKCQSVSFENVPAFATHLDAQIRVPTLGTVTVDVAFGGMWFVIADAERLGIAIEPDNAAEIARVGEMLRAAAAQQLPVVHPDNPRIRDVSIAQLSATSGDADVSHRNAVVISTGELDWERPETWRGVLDRSPCGTGTCAKMATLYARGELGLDEDFHHQGILGTVFTGRLVRECSVGNHRAVVPTLTGSGWIYGLSQYVVDDEDPFPDGFTVADIWARGI